MPRQLLPRSCRNFFPRRKRDIFFLDVSTKWRPVAFHLHLTLSCPSRETFFHVTANFSLFSAKCYTLKKYAKDCFPWIKILRNSKERRDKQLQVCVWVCDLYETSLVTPRHKAIYACIICSMTTFAFALYCGNLVNDINSFRELSLSSERTALWVSHYGWNIWKLF